MEGDIYEVSHTIDGHEATCLLAASEIAPLITAGANIDKIKVHEPDFPTTESLLHKIPILANSIRELFLHTTYL